MNIVKRKDKGNGLTTQASRPTSMLELKSEMDRLFERFFHEPWGLTFGGRLADLPEAIEPAIDISETDSHVVVRAEVPGVDPDKFEVSATEESLTIAGEKEESEETEGENYYRSERRFGSFRRTIPLPTAIDPDKVDAKFKNGVLRIEMKKATPSHSKKIQVKAS